MPRCWGMIIYYCVILLRNVWQFDALLKRKSSKVRVLDFSLELLKFYQVCGAFIKFVLSAERLSFSQMDQSLGSQK